jgi:hypothetical protein
MANKIEIGKSSYCVSCKREYPIDRFYQIKANEEFNPSHVTCYCDACVKDMVKYYLDKVKNLEKAVWYTCAKLDVPFIKEVYKKAEEMKNQYQAKGGKSDSEYDIFKYYYSFLWGNKSIEKTTDMWHDFTDTDISVDEIDGSRETEKFIKEQVEKLSMEWGEQETVDDYKFLVYNYNKYTKDLKISTPQQEDLYRDLCLARLEKRKAEEGRIDSDITKIQNRILNIMSKLKIDNFADNKPKSLSDQLVFNKIAMVEEHEPCEFYKDPKKWKDVHGGRKYMEDMVLRPLMNTLAGTKDFDISMDDIEKYNIRIDKEYEDD